MILSRRAQVETGPLQKLMFVLLLVSGVAVLSLSFMSDLGSPFGVSFDNSSSLENLNQLGSTQNRTEQIASTFSDVSNPVDFITSIVTGGYNVLLLFVQDIPNDFAILTDTVGEVVGVPYVSQLLWVGILIIAVFAVVALVMKVRA